VAELLHCLWQSLLSLKVYLSLLIPSWPWLVGGLWVEDWVEREKILEATFSLLKAKANTGSQE